MRRAESPVSPNADAMLLLERAPAAPQEVIDRFRGVAEAAVAAGDPSSAAVALRAGGLAHLIAAQPLEALAWLEHASARAEESGDSAIVGGVEVTAAAAFAWAGDGAKALATIDQAVGRLSGVEQVRARVQRGTLRYRFGDMPGAVRDFDAAESPLQSRDDTIWLARLHGNRGLALGMIGKIADAERDLAAAVREFEGEGHAAAAAQSLQNLGWLHSRSGDFPAALQALDEAEGRFEALGLPLGELWGDRADVLLAANLVGDGKRLAVLAAERLAESGMAVGHAEAMLRVAFASLLDRDEERAKRSADAAFAELTAQDRPAWAAYAEYIGTLSEASRGGLSAVDAAKVKAIADRLRSAGFLAESVRAGSLAAQLELQGGNRRVAQRELARLATLRRHPSFELRIAAWVAEARLRLTRDDRRGADAAARAGLAVSDAWQATMGGPELRALVAGHAEELAAIGLELAHASGRPRRIFRWMERTRAGALRFPPVRPPDDGALAGELAAWREAEVQLRASQLRGEADDALVLRARRLRRSIRRRSQRRSSGSSSVPSALPVGQVQEALLRTGTTTLIELAAWDGAVVAVVLTPRRAVLHRLHAIGDVRQALDRLRFALSRSVAAHGSHASRSLARTSAEAAYLELDQLLLAPLGWDGDRVVVIPTAELHAVPWGMLPSLRGRTVTVAPSARLWVERSQTARRQRRGVVVANGPGIHGAQETRRVASLYPGAQRFTARTSTVDAMLAALDGSRLAHLVAHGSFQPDNPLFSSLRFADGGLTVYDLERVDRMPPTMILSACNSGLQAARPGNETMGFVAALLSAGCRTVVASTGLVPDTTRTARTMEEFHRRLVRGESPATALAEAQSAAVAAGDDGLAAASFVCFGAG